MLAVLAGGSGVPAYIVLVIVLQTGDTEGGRLERPPAEQWRSPQGQQMAALLLIGIGGLLLFGNLGWLAWLRADLNWPLALIALGTAILLARGGRADI